jgi:ABC-type transporter Mla maintaining outer membrane lipid asymmetry ATPase subunit MlaF
MYDEPFAGLDPISLGLTANLIRDLNDALGATTIIVSHDVQETFQIADYVYFIANGRSRPKARPRSCAARRSVRAPVRPRRGRRPGAVPLSGPRWPMISAGGAR